MRVVDNHEPLLHAIAAQAIPICSDFRPQALSNTAWAFATLELHDRPLRNAISSSALRIIGDFEAQELCNTAWAFAFSRDNDPGPLDAIRAACLEAGRKADLAKDRASGATRNVVDITEVLESPLGYAEPTLELKAPGLVVILKPAGWETDVYDVARYGVPITPVARFYLLSTFLGRLYAKEDHPICHSPEDGFGFVHRLDQMSSGLILAATKYEAHSLLQWQMCCYRIAREYFVLGHGLIMPTGSRSGVLHVRQRILEGRVRARCTYGERCQVDARGKPAETRVLSAAHFRLGAHEEAVTAAIISIVTGRQHQIRTHLQHIGHPSVYDGRYVQQALLLRSGSGAGAGLRLADARLASEQPPRPRPLPEKHRAELALRGAYPW